MHKFDVVIIGAGIAGLWTANRLQQMGLSVLVLEHAHIGDGQTIHSQGIIHGGIKYSLTGKLSSATRAIANMPGIWQDCLAGRGDIDLSDAKTLSEHYVLWAAENLASKFGTMLASKVLQGHNKRITHDAYPSVLNSPEFTGQVYQVSERVVDVASVLHALTKPLQNRIVKIKSWHTEMSGEDIASLVIENDKGDGENITAQKYIFTAGSGNQLICNQSTNIQMQKRPLHMVYAKLNQDLPFYAHCVDMQQVPRVTITTHYTPRGECVWYLGGNIAETGIARSAAEQCQHTKNELQKILPWVTMDQWQFSSFLIDRAECKQTKGSRPNSFSIEQQGNSIVAWPTKLAFAPALADAICQQCQTLSPQNETASLDWPMPSIAKPIWEL